MLPVEQPFKIYTGLDGAPLNNGFVYFGLPNQNPITAPVTVYWDAAGTLPAAQPLRTINGYIVRAGTPANVFLDGAYSVLVQDAKGAQVSYAGTSAEFGVAAMLNNIIAQQRTLNTIDVTSYGATGGGTVDDYAAFQSAIAALPALGGRIVVPAGTYLLTAQPDWGTKSIYWDISPGATFTGAGTGQNKFPSMRTNGGQIPVGPFIQSQSRVPYTTNNGGVAAFQVEMIQPGDVTGQSVALYLGAEGSNPAANANVWAGNFLIKAAPGAGGTYQGIELDVDCFSDAALVKGLSINGVGTANPDVGIELIRSDATRWKVGVDLMQCITGIKVRNTSGLTQGIIVGDPAAQASVGISTRQLSDGGDAFVLQRYTDTNPTGYLMRAVDAGNTTSLTTLDILGNLTTIGIYTGHHVTLKGAASTKPAGQFAIGATNQQTVGALGSAAALPAQPRGYLICYDGPTKVAIPYYNA